MLAVGNGKGYAYPKSDAQAMATDGTSRMWAQVHTFVTSITTNTGSEQGLSAHAGERSVSIYAMLALLTKQQTL